MTNIKEKIIDTSLELFNNQGFKNVSLRSIASELKISHSNLIYHFKDKEAIITSIYDRLYQKAVELNASIQDEENSINRIKNSVKIGFQITYDFRFLFLEQYYLTNEYPLVLNHFLEAEKFRKDLYMKEFQHAISHNYFKSTLSSDEMNALIEHIKIFGDTWIISAHIYDKELSINQKITKYSELFEQLLKPYLILH